MSDVINSQQIKLYLRLKQQECGLDKSLAAFIDSAKSDLENWKSIKRDIDKFECERRKIEDPLREMIIDIYQELKSVKEMMTPDNVQKLDLEDFKKKLQSLWKRIEEFKNSCANVDDLSSEQKNLTNELDELSRKIRKHENFNSSENFYTRIVSVKATLQKQESTAKECDYSEVENFFALISNSGHTGGWSERDHLLYTKLRNKHKSTEALVSALRAKCPDLSEESILKHEAWYKTYLDLRQKQKVAVQEWRERKEAERQKKKTPAVKEEKDKPVKVDVKVIAERNEAAIEKRKEMLNKWKAQKAIKKFLEEEEEKERLLIQTKSRKELRDVRRRVRSAKVKKITDHEEKKEEPAKPRRPSFRSSLFLQLYRARDQQYLEKRKKILAKVNAPKQELIQRDYYPKCHESTLLKETKAWQEKLKLEIVKSARTVFYIKDVPRLGKSNQTSDSSLNRHL